MPSIDRQAMFSGTKDVAGALAIDTARLEAFLAARLPDFAGPLSVRQFKGGQSNPTYLLETPARRYVLRRKPPGKLLPSAHAVDREFRVISALMRKAFPVAAPLLYCDDAEHRRHAVLSHGATSRAASSGSRTCRIAQPAERAAVYDAMNATLARLHSFDPAALGLGDFGRGDNYVARQVERWSKQYRASETGCDRGDGTADRLAARASAAGRAGADRARRLSPRQHHSCAVRAEDSRAVLDWELSTLGDPLADLAYHLMQWDMPPSETGAGVGTLLGHDLGRLGIPSHAAYVDAYVARTGLDPRPHLPVYLAYNFFRLAAILQGIVGRVRDGTATSENAAAMAPLVRPLAAKAWEFAREAGAR